MHRGGHGGEADGVVSGGYVSLVMGILRSFLIRIKISGKIMEI
jgi:hypothetical protein